MDISANDSIVVSRAPQSYGTQTGLHTLTISTPICPYHYGERQELIPALITIIGGSDATGQSFKPTPYTIRIIVVCFFTIMRLVRRQLLI